MSLSCPRCGNSIEQDFGMITCGQCQTILFIDMEGHIQIAGDESAESASSSIAHAPSDEAMEVESGSVDSDQALMEPSAGPSFADSNESFADPVDSQAAVADTDDSYTDSNPSFGRADDMPAAAPNEMPVTAATNSASEASQTFASSEVFSEVSDFGNNKQDFGALSYTLHIENIDTGEIRQKLAEALTDSKFQWDVNELLQKIEKGRLEIAQINPVKASILVHRLQEVPVRVSWDQKLL